MSAADSVVTLERVSEGLPALSVETWQQLGGATPALLEFNREAMLTYCAAMDGEFYVAALRRGDRLRALAICLAGRNATGTPVLSIFLPGTLVMGRYARGLWVAAHEEDEPGALRALLEGLAAHASSRGLRLVALCCAADNQRLRQVAEALGGRALAAPADNRLVLSPQDTFESYLTKLASKRHNLVRDLRRPSEAGATILIEHPASEDSLRRCWPLQLDYYRRFAEPVLPRAGENLFLRLGQRLARHTGLVMCERDGALLGFLLFHRVEQTSQFVHLGHVPKEELGGFQLYVSLVSQYLQHEIHDGARTFLFGYHQEQYKARLGCASYPQVHYYFPNR